MLFQQQERERERERITIIKSKYLCITLCNKAIFKLINFAIQTQCFVRRAFSPRAKGEARRGSIVYYRRGEAISEWRDVATERRQATWRGDRRHLFNFFKRSDLIIKSQHQVFFWGIFANLPRNATLLSIARPTLLILASCDPFESEDKTFVFLLRGCCSANVRSSSSFFSFLLLFSLLCFSVGRSGLVLCFRWLVTSECSVFSFYVGATEAELCNTYYCY